MLDIIILFSFGSRASSSTFLRKLLIRCLMFVFVIWWWKVMWMVFWFVGKINILWFIFNFCINILEVMSGMVFRTRTRFDFGVAYSRLVVFCSVFVKVFVCLWFFVIFGNILLIVFKVVVVKMLICRIESFNVLRNRFVFRINVLLLSNMFLMGVLMVLFK